MAEIEVAVGPNGEDKINIDHGATYAVYFHFDDTIPPGEEGRITVTEIINADTTVPLLMSGPKFNLVRLAAIQTIEEEYAKEVMDDDGETP